MSDLRQAQRLLDAAERSATAGDFAAAAKQLGAAARIQEAELGPLHPDLANTLNNLAIITETTGRPEAAEPIYRRAAGIAAASLPPDHPMVAASRSNLEEFCRARGVPVDLPIVLSPSPRDIELGLDAFAPDVAGTAPAPAQAGAVGRATPVTSPSGATPGGAPPGTEASVASMSGPPRPAPGAPAPTAAQPFPTSRPGSRSLMWLVAGAVVLAAAALFVTRPWTSRDPSPPPPTAASTAPPVSEPAPAPEPTAQATRPVPPPAIVDPSAQDPPQIDAPIDAQEAATAQAPASAPGGAVSVATAQVCRTFSTSGGSWRCDPAGDVAAPGLLVFFTRVKSPRDVDVVHRWYRGETLRKSVTLSVRANPTDGYRTYSRHTVDAADGWRVELRSSDDQLLFEQRFTVK